MKKSILLAAATAALTSAAFAAPFTAGNIIVSQIGDGAAALTSGGQALFLKEFTTTGTLVQTITVPTATAGTQRGLVVNGTSATEAYLALSADGQYITFTGYEAALGGTAVQDVAGTRVVARLDWQGNLDTSTGMTNAYQLGNIRNAVTNDGTGYWTAGTDASAPQDSGGAYYVAHGASTGTRLTTSDNNIRIVDIYNGQLYAFSNTNPIRGISALGTGLPTTDVGSSTLLTGFPGTTAFDGYDFEFVASNTVFIADTAQGLKRWTETGGTWSQANVDNAQGGVRGLTGSKSGSNVTLYITKSDGTGLYKWESTNDGASGTFTLVASAPANTAYRGVAFVPQQATVEPETNAARWNSYE